MLALQEDGFGNEKYFKCFVAERQENGMYGCIKLFPSNTLDSLLYPRT